MANNETLKQGETWPLPKYSFRVKWDDIELNFTEVSGLSIDNQIIAYRAGDSKVFSPIKMAGIQKVSNVTMKKGIFIGDNKLWDKFNQIKMNNLKRSTVTISLIDESQLVAMSWTLINAFPTKINMTDLKASGNEVAVESMEFAHEGLTLNE